MRGGAHDLMAVAELDPSGIPLPEAELQTRFEALQRKRPQWELIESFNDEPHAIVVVPSLGGVDLPLDATKRKRTRSDARRRLYLVSPRDGGPPPLSAKLLERPRLMDEIRSRGCCSPRSAPACAVFQTPFAGIPNGVPN